MRSSEKVTLAAWGKSLGLVTAGGRFRTVLEASGDTGPVLLMGFDLI